MFTRYVQELFSNVIANLQGSELLLSNNTQQIWKTNITRILVIYLSKWKNWP